MFKCKSLSYGVMADFMNSADYYYSNVITVPGTVPTLLT